MNRAPVISIIIFTAVVWLGAAVYWGVPNNLVDATKPFGTAISASTGLMLAYKYLLWRLPGFRSWFRAAPNIAGAWRITLITDWKDPVTGKAPPPISGYVQIDQTASTLSIRMFTDKSRSNTVSWAFVSDHSVFTLSIVYDNKPRIQDREQVSRAHQGAAVFEMRGSYPDRLDGEYWTERKTIGQLNFHERKKIEINSYDEAKKKFGDK